VLATALLMHTALASHQPASMTHPDAQTDVHAAVVSLAGSTASWVDLVSSQTASFQPPTSQTSQRVQAPKPAAKHSSASSPPAFRPSIRLQQHIQAAQEQDQQQQQHQQQCARLSCKPGMNREAEKDRLAAVVSILDLPADANILGTASGNA
jgi:hypothetical protein